MKIVDGHPPSRDATAAFGRAVEIATERGAELRIVRVVGQPQIDEEQGLEKLTAGLPPEMRARTHRRVPAGSEQQIDASLRFADQEGTDLILIGMRRLSRAGKTLFGSTAQGTLLDTNCPVLAVKATPEV